MLLLWSSLLVTVQFSPADDCIYDGISISDRQVIGQAVLAKESATVTDLTMQATDRCAREHRWSTQRALQMNGSASMRFAADSRSNGGGIPLVPFHFSIPPRHLAAGTSLCLTRTA